jgi:hypothetical protein
MIPQHACRLEVRVVVILVLARVRYIGGPPIEWGTAWRSVQMDRILPVGAVYESYNSLCAFRNDDSRTRRLPIVSNQPSRLELGVDLLGERLDLKLLHVKVSYHLSTLYRGSTNVVPNLLLRNGVCDFTKRH